MGSVDGSTLSLSGAPAKEGLAEVSLPRPGDLIGGRYEIVSEIGRGAQGVVFRAHDRVAGEPVALKLLGGGQRSPADIDRFRRELQGARRIAHRCVVRMHDLVELDGWLALSMELVVGETLAARLARSGRVAADELDRLAVDLAQALAAAHEQGIIHCDLKPSNVMVRAADGSAVVTDFGLASWQVHGAVNRVAGTPAYMAPEQLAGAAVTPAADVYSLGLLLWECATGSRPHPGETVEELREARMGASVLPVQRLPRRVRRLVERCLQPDPAARYRDGRAVCDRLSRRNRAIGGVTMAAIAVLAMSIGLVAHRSDGRHDWQPRTAALSFERENFDRVAVSPDGRHLGIASTREGGTWCIWLYDLQMRSWRRLTEGPGDTAVRFIEGGRAVLFRGERRGWSGLWRLNLDGDGTPQFFSDASGRAGVDREGERILFRRSDGHWRFVDLKSGQAREPFVLQDGLFPRDVVLDDDGRRAAVLLTNGDAERTLLLADLESGSIRQLDSGHIDTPTFVPHSPSLMVARERDGVRTLWQVFFDGRPARSLTAGGDEIGPAFSADGRRLFYTRDVTYLPIFARTPEHPEWVQLTNDRRFRVSLAFNRTGDGLFEVLQDPAQVRRAIWVRNPILGPSRPLVAAETVLALAPSPDGRWFAAVERRGQTTTLVRLAVDGKRLDKWADLPAESCLGLSVGRDGTAAVALMGMDSELVLVSPDGRATVAARGGVCSARFAPDGRRRLAFARRRERGFDVVVRDLSNGMERVIWSKATRVYPPLDWDAEGKTLFIADSDARAVLRVDPDRAVVTERIPQPGEYVEEMAAGGNGTIAVRSVIGEAQLMTIENIQDGLQ